MPAKRLWIALGLLVAAALACSTPGSSGPLLRDDFSRSGSGWDVDEDETAKVAYSDGAYVFDVFEANWLIWGKPKDASFSNVRVEVDASNSGEAADPTFGIICNYQDSDNFYFMGIGADGYYAIVHHDAGVSQVLSNDQNLWVESEDIEKDKDTYRLAADCASDGTLRLTVDGQVIAEAADDTLTKGNVGLFVLSFDDTPVQVKFDNLVVNDLAKLPASNENSQ